jgi:hypothetical protein
MLMEQAQGIRSLRAPQADGQKVIEPPLATLPQVVAANREQLAHIDYDVQGRSLAELSSSARRRLVERAIAYTLQYRDVPERLRRFDALANLAEGARGRGLGTESNTRIRIPQPLAPSPPPFILAGHQPQLFHPGVWYKNFVLGSLSRQLAAVPVHLLIDSDLCRSASIRVPTGTTTRPSVEVVRYDEPAEEMPYEERSILDQETLRSFSGRVATMIRPFVPDPLVEPLWNLLESRNPREANLGLRLAQARHALEETWQNDTLELPQSVVCQQPEFAWFLAHVLAHLPRFWAAYNDALATYRRSQHLRNRAHPVPDLAEVDGWLETPFWIWTADDPRRKPLFAQQSGDELVISDRCSRTFRLSLTADCDAATAVEQLLELTSRGVKIRTRALTTTLYARLVLSDLFLHGIGGAKYDQVTDQIARTFFGFVPPEFAAVSATLRLPIAAKLDAASGERSCAEQLRELRYHPERHIDAAEVHGSDLQKIITEKRRWVESAKTLQNAHERHVAIASANEALQPFVAERGRAIKARCYEQQEQQRAAAILQSREYSFCLYPKRHFEKLLNS